MMDVTIRVGQGDIESVGCLSDLGVLLDSSLSMHQHIATVTSTCFLVFDSFASLVVYLILTHESDLSAL